MIDLLWDKVLPLAMTVVSAAVVWEVVDMMIENNCDSSRW